MSTVFVPRTTGPIPRAEGGAPLDVSSTSNRPPASPAPALAQRQELDETAFRALYHQTANDLRRYVVRLTGSVTFADDIVQEAFLRLLRSPPSTIDPEELRAFLFRVTSNLVVDQWRRDSRRATAPVDPAPSTTAAPDHVLRLDLDRVFRTLKLRDRQMLWLAHVEGAAHRDIARILGLREGSIRVLLSRARQRLARLLGGEGGSR